MSSLFLHIDLLRFSDFHFFAHTQKDNRTVPPQLQWGSIEWDEKEESKEWETTTQVRSWVQNHSNKIRIGKGRGNMYSHFHPYLTFPNGFISILKDWNSKSSNTSSHSRWIVVRNFIVATDISIPNSPGYIIIFAKHLIFRHSLLYPHKWVMLLTKSWSFYFLLEHE